MTSSFIRILSIAALLSIAVGPVGCAGTTSPGPSASERAETATTAPGQSTAASVAPIASPKPGSSFATGATPTIHASLSWKVLARHPQKLVFGGLAIAPTGEIWATEPMTHTVWKFSPDGAKMAEFGGKGNEPGQFSTPAGIATDRDGNVYVADSMNRRIQKLSPSGKPLAQFGKRGKGPGEYQFPVDVAVDSQGNVYVADSDNYCVHKLSPTGEPVWQVGKRGAKLGQFETVMAVAVDSQGNVFAADHGEHSARLVKLSAAGEPLSQWPLAVGVFGLESSTAVPEMLIYGIAFDAEDNFYLANFQQSRIEKWSSEGKLLTTWGITGEGGKSGWPYEVALDGKGSIYVFETSTYSIEKASLAGAGQ